MAATPEVFGVDQLKVERCWSISVHVLQQTLVECHILWTKLVENRMKNSLRKPEKVILGNPRGVDPANCEQKCDKNK